MSHQKHAKLNQPSIGEFHRNEWAILGTTCGKIKKLAYGIIDALAENWKVAYVDADHKHGDEDGPLPNSLQYGAAQEYTDKITHHQLNWQGKFEKHQYRARFNGQDMVLINGNHFQGQKQIVVIDPVKENSLKKRLGQIRQIDMILFADKAQPIYPFLTEKFPDIEQVPSFELSDINTVAQQIAGLMEAAKLPVYGLVLAGGKSQRMGQDKGEIDYHGKPQREYMADVLAKACDEVFLSARSDQEIESAYSVLPDSFLGLGPLGGLLSAFRENPNAAWLVAACDLPLLDLDAINELIEARNISKVATAFNSPVNEFPEPLIAIWEPKAYQIALEFLAQGYSCPRKVLINSEVELIDASSVATLMNVNNPDEYEKVMRVLQQK